MYALNTRCYSLQLHEQYAHDIALRALDVSCMPVIDGQMELSHVNVV